MITIEDLKDRLGLFGISGYRDLQTEFFDIWCDYNSYSDANVEVTSNSIILDVEVVSVTTTTQYPVTIDLSSYNNLTSLKSEIESYSGWSIITYVRSEASPASLIIQPETFCLGYDNRISLYGQHSYLLTNTIDRAIDFVQDRCNRKFQQDTYTETLSGNNEYKIRLDNYPVDSISEIEKLDDDNWETVDSSSYNFDESTGTIYNKEDVWEEGFENYRVNYTGGYSEVPEALKNLTLEVAAILWNNVGNNPKVSREKIGSYQTTFINEFMTPEIEDRLNYWSRKDL